MRFIAFVLATASCLAFQQPEDRKLSQLIRSDPSAFARRIIAEADDDFQRAQAIVTWLAGNFDWTATDYRRRTVEEIIQRGGGNCAELARVTTFLLNDLGLRMRQVREINLHRRSERRQASPEAKIRQGGAGMSVFGRQHNDHVWIEIWDEKTLGWFPADPSLGLVGERQWLESRLGFGERYSLDPSSQDMIAPFAVFAYEQDRLVEDRTRHYLIDGFNRLYSGRLQGLPAWDDWVSGVLSLSPKAAAAFQGRVNLHDFDKEISSLDETYRALKEQFQGE